MVSTSLSSAIFAYQYAQFFQKAYVKPAYIVCRSGLTACKETVPSV
ncbi:hypothetical protein HMPREF3213_01041 [Heyndrickxia coagulans]|uniref:Uncharacterized protein n=1 Tax=Heyndrickxia coagulans TaxID=1398 RepID=A0A133KWX5_HEYCO|nr:hypothetical protein HMPREF3213_01041 [Heyndrickxia coagulans]